MAERVLKRRDEYFEHKQDRKASRSVISAAVAACAVVVVILFGTIIGSTMKAPAAQETDAPSAASSQGSTEITAEETEFTAENTEEITDTQPETESKVMTYEDETKSNQQNENKYPVPIEFVPNPDSPVVIEENTTVNIYGVECQDIIRYQMRYNTRRNFGRECGNRVRLLIAHSDSIELLSPDVLTLDISNDDSVTFEIVFRYVDGNTRGGISVFSIEDLYWDIDNNYNSAAELPELRKSKGFREKFTERKFGAVRTKGYDFFSGVWDTTTIYYNIAYYFNEVDDEGNPLFLSDPYMPDYYDCETCQRLRQEIEEREKFNTECYQESNGVAYSRNYDIIICGYAHWTDNQGQIHPAKNISVRLKDLSDASINILTMTNNMGYYQITYPLSLSGNHNLIISCEVSGLAIKVIQNNGTNPLKKDIACNCTSGETRMIFFDFAPGASDYDEESLLNDAVSIHQACELIQQYFYQLTCTFLPQVIINADWDHFIEEDMEARYYQYPIGYDLFVSYLDAYDWDKIEYEYIHFIEDIYDMYFYNYYVNRYTNSALYYGKENGVKYAWQDGWAMFFAINAQRNMNASNLNMEYVGDTFFTDFDAWHGKDINFDLENFILYFPTNTSINKCEANILTIAALMYDFCDPVNIYDNDLMCFNDVAVWYYTVFNGTCKSLSDFIQKIYYSGVLSTSDKLQAGRSLEWFDLSPSNVSMPGLFLGNYTVYWTNPSSNSYNILRFYDSSYNEIVPSIFINGQNTYTISYSDWTENFVGVGTIYLVVERIDSNYPVTGPYYSEKYTFVA